MKMDDAHDLEVNGKPACIVTRLPGEPEPFPEEEECHIVGRVLAGIHVAGVEYDAGLENWRGREWRERFAEEVRPKLTRAENDLIAPRTATRRCTTTACFRRASSMATSSTTTCSGMTTATAA
jgi:Ser/Thr protein kinase RdoA (MazF antagonist)